LQKYVVLCAFKKNQEARVLWVITPDNGENKSQGESGSGSSSGRIKGWDKRGRSRRVKSQESRTESQESRTKSQEKYG